MNTKSHTVKQVEQKKPSFFVVEQKEREDMSTEVTMSDIAKKLRSVYAQMQMKHSSRYSTSQSFVEESFKSYLDDISRAILAEHYIRRQKEKKLFEYLEQIKTLIQSLHSEKKNLEEATITRCVSRSKSLDSVVQKLADMTGEGNQERLLLQKVSDCSKQNSITPNPTNFENMLQQGSKSSSPDVIKPFAKEAEEIVGHSTIEERCSDIQASRCCIEDDCSPSLKKSQRTVFFLRSSIKKIFWCFLIIAFMAAITLCFYGFLREIHFFNFDVKFR
ncbi:hypothetical protein HWV54_01890 [Bartonella alsatica]|uniref:Uncharacterized protein n=2 Tax=Bartonella alsatica TaxID=52764 RepID=J0PU40_9HYPH|nr:hypothetical protein [Bartonella alsatica]EJF76056.1 hypothetical protein MEC_00165 [Bartonella alsatica IBS 382]QLC51711.1 hypothetical protein HWV54_01890 [Bartonella alsatica]